MRTHKAEWLVPVCILLLDRVTKRLAMVFLAEQEIALCPYLYLNYVQNTGAAFGMMQGGNLFFIIVSLLIIGYILKNWKEYEIYEWDFRKKI